MALTLIGRPKGLTATKVGGGSLTLTGKLQSASFTPEKELVDFKLGDANVQSHFEGVKGGTITVEFTDFAAWSTMFIGQKYTAVKLIGEAAADTEGTAAGGEIGILMSHAVISELSEAPFSSENKAPAVVSATFRLSRFPGESADPTITIAEES